MFVAIQSKSCSKIVRIPPQGLRLAPGQTVVKQGTWQECRDALLNPPVFVETLYDDHMNWQEMRERLVG